MLYSTVQEQCHLEAGKVLRLDDHTKTLELELETTRSHLVDSRNTVDQCKKDKQAMYQGQTKV